MKTREKGEFREKGPGERFLNPPKGETQKASQLTMKSGLREEKEKRSGAVAYTQRSVSKGPGGGGF